MTTQEKRIKINNYLEKKGVYGKLYCPVCSKINDKYLIEIRNTSVKGYFFAKIEMLLAEDENPIINLKEKFNILSF